MVIFVGQLVQLGGDFIIFYGDFCSGCIYSTVKTTKKFICFSVVIHQRYDYRRFFLGFGWLLGDVREGQINACNSQSSNPTHDGVEYLFNKIPINPCVLSVLIHNSHNGPENGLTTE